MLDDSQSPRPPKQVPTQQQPLPPSPPESERAPLLKSETKWYRRTWMSVLTILLTPPIGFFVMWLFAPWKKYVKILITVPLIFTSMFFVLTLTGIVQNTVNQFTQSGPEKVKLESFLEQKYSKQFIVKKGEIVSSGGFGVKFTSYKAEVSPRDDPGIVFQAGRIVSGQDLAGKSSSDPDRINYHDDYLETLWSNELTNATSSNVKSITPGFSSYSLDLSLGGTHTYRASVFDSLWGTAPRYSDLSNDIKKKLGGNVELKSEGSVDSSNIRSYAEAVLEVRRAIDSKNIGLSTWVHYGIYKNKDDPKPTWELKTPSEGTMLTITPERLESYFIEWSNGYGRNYNPKTGVFDASGGNLPV